MNTPMTRRGFGTILAVSIAALLSPSVTAGSIDPAKLAEYERECRRYYRWWSAHLRRYYPEQPFPPIQSYVCIVSRLPREFWGQNAEWTKKISVLRKETGLPEADLEARFTSIKTWCDAEFVKDFGSYGPENQGFLAEAYYIKAAVQPETPDEKMTVLCNQAGFLSQYVTYPVTRGQLELYEMCFLHRNRKFSNTSV